VIDEHSYNVHCWSLMDHVPLSHTLLFIALNQQETLPRSHNNVILWNMMYNYAGVRIVIKERLVNVG
jgi:hypothetical protein